MVERRRGRLVNVASVEGLRGYPPDPVYGAYKAAVVHFTRCLAARGAAGACGSTRSSRTSPRPRRSTTPWCRPNCRPLAHAGCRWGGWARAGTMLTSCCSCLGLSRFVTGHVIPTDGGTLAAGGWFRTDTGRWTNRPRNP